MPEADRLQLLTEYKRPPFANADDVGSLSFGFAGSGSGVPFHRHGHVFAEVMHGRKRWFLYDVDKEPQFDPNETTLRWSVSGTPHLAVGVAPVADVGAPGCASSTRSWPRTSCPWNASSAQEK